MAPTDRVRLNHPPDFIINGKPKWTELLMTESASTEKTHVVDRLNPSRNMIGSLESACEEAETTQKVLVNMMCDLKCELVVTLGDARLGQDEEERLMKEHQEWELYKVRNVIVFSLCLFETLQRKYEWKSTKAVKEKPKKKKESKEKKRKVKKSIPKPKAASPEGGKENAAQFWRNVFLKAASTSSQASKPKKKAIGKNSTSSTNTLKTTQILNFLIKEKD